MRLRNFIWDSQRIPTITSSSFRCESQPTDDDGTIPIRPRFDTIRLFQCATLEHTGSVEAETSTSGSFYCIALSGSITKDHIWTGDRLKMTGSISGEPDSVSAAAQPPLAMQIFMIADGDFKG